MQHVGQLNSSSILTSTLAGPSGQRLLTSARSQAHNPSTWLASSTCTATAMAAAADSPALCNTYWLLRHGRSNANEQDVIVSRPDNGQDLRWGLSEVGRQQAAAAGRQLAAALAAEPGYAQEQLLVLASPFSRTVQTAEGAGAALGLSPDDSRMQVCREGGCSAPSCSRARGPTMAVAALQERSPLALPGCSTCTQCYHPGAVQQSAAHASPYSTCSALHMFAALRTARGPLANNTPTRFGAGGGSAAGTLLWGLRDGLLLELRASVGAG